MLSSTPIHRTDYMENFRGGSESSEFSENLADDDHQKHMPGNFIFVNSSRRLQKSRILGVISSLALAMKPTQFFAPITLIASDVISVCSIRTAPHLSKYSSRTLVLELPSLKFLRQSLDWAMFQGAFWVKFKRFSYSDENFCMASFRSWSVFSYFWKVSIVLIFDSTIWSWRIFVTSIRKSRWTVSTRLDFST